MKKLISLVFFSVSICFLDGCNNDDPSAWETTTDALINDSKTWTIDGGMVSMDGSEVTDSFASFSITFSGTSYTSSSGGDVWPDATGASWIFKGTDDSDASTILRTDQVEVQIIVSKGDQLTMTFTVSAPGARTSGLTGYYTFELKSGV